MASFRELLADAKSKIKEVDTQTAAAKIDANHDHERIVEIRRTVSEK